MEVSEVHPLRLLHAPRSCLRAFVRPAFGKALASRSSRERRSQARRQRVLSVAAARMLAFGRDLASGSIRARMSRARRQRVLSGAAAKELAFSLCRSTWRVRSSSSSSSPQMSLQLLRPEGRGEEVGRGRRRVLRRRPGRHYRPRSYERRVVDRKQVWPRDAVWHRHRSQAHQRPHNASQQTHLTPAGDGTPSREGERIATQPRRRQPRR